MSQLCYEQRSEPWLQQMTHFFFFFLKMIHHLSLKKVSFHIWCFYCSVILKTEHFFWLLLLSLLFSSPLQKVYLQLDTQLLSHTLSHGGIRTLSSCLDHVLASCVFKWISSIQKKERAGERGRRSGRREPKRYRKDRGMLCICMRYNLMGCCYLTLPRAAFALLVTPTNVCTSVNVIHFCCSFIFNSDHLMQSVQLFSTGK